MSIKIIEDTIKAYHEVVDSDCKKEREKFFRIALENVEREVRHATINEFSKTVNKINNKLHY